MKVKTNIPEFNFTGHQLAEAGLSVAVENADRKYKDWSKKVWSLFWFWLNKKKQYYQFTIEDFRTYLDKYDLIEKPDSERAYGFISRRAQKEGLIQFIKTVKSKRPKVHGANAGLWFKK